MVQLIKILVYLITACLLHQNVRRSGPRIFLIVASSVPRRVSGPMYLSVNIWYIHKNKKPGVIFNFFLSIPSLSTNNIHLTCQFCFLTTTWMHLGAVSIPTFILLVQSTSLLRNYCSHSRSSPSERNHISSILFSTSTGRMNSLSGNVTLLNTPVVPH